MLLKYNTITAILLFLSSTRAQGGTSQGVTAEPGIFSIAYSYFINTWTVIANNIYNRISNKYEPRPVFQPTEVPSLGSYLAKKEGWFSGLKEWLGNHFKQLDNRADIEYNQDGVWVKGDFVVTGHDMSGRGFYISQFPSISFLLDPRMLTVIFGVAAILACIFYRFLPKKYQNYALKSFPLFFYTFTFKWALCIFVLCFGYFKEQGAFCYLLTFSNLFYGCAAFNFYLVLFELIIILPVCCILFKYVMGSEIDIFSPSHFFELARKAYNQMSKLLGLEGKWFGTAIIMGFQLLPQLIFIPGVSSLIALIPAIVACIPFAEPLIVVPLGLICSNVILPFLNLLMFGIHLPIISDNLMAWSLLHNIRNFIPGIGPFIECIIRSMVSGFLNKQVMFVVFPFITRLVLKTNRFTNRDYIRTSNMD